jgi:hypothetical protein
MIQLLEGEKQSQLYLKILYVPLSKHTLHLGYKNQSVNVVCREIIAVCSQIHTKHINTRCGQNVELLNVKLLVHMVTTGLYWVKSLLLKTVS